MSKVANASTQYVIDWKEKNTVIDMLQHWKWKATDIVVALFYTEPIDKERRIYASRN